MKFESPLVLGIETSCDDTACAVVDGHGRVLASVVSSQLEAHQPYGGVVPEIASREHLKNWPHVCREALRQAGLEIRDVDAIAATRGPGLVGCLLVGLSLGRAMAFALDKPFHGMHHLEGHLYSPFLASGIGEINGAAEASEAAEAVPNRFLGFVVSGGHTSLLDVDAGRVTSLIESRDDAMGEVFDKVGKRVGLTYPQGPRVDLLAEKGDASRFKLPVPQIKGGQDLFFSYSGLKTQAIREIERLERQGLDLTGMDLTGRDLDDVAQVPQDILDLLAAFRLAAVKQIIDRLERRHRQQKIEVLAVSGGAAANRLLRRELETWAKKRRVDLRLVPLRFSGDNAAMIAFAALLRQRRGLVDDPLDAVAQSRIPFAPAIAPTIQA